MMLPAREQRTRPGRILVLSPNARARRVPARAFGARWRAVWRASGPRAALVRPFLRTHLAAMRGEFVDVGGCRLYYYAAGTRGAGGPLIFLPRVPAPPPLRGAVAR